MNAATPKLSVPVTANHLFYGDNLEILRKHIPDESVDLIYLDPPFNSQVNYNVLFKAPTGEQSQAQIEAFQDTWHWNAKAEDAFDQIMTSGNTDAAELVRAIRQFLKENDMMAYLVMMGIRLIELHRVLKPNGSLYLHCDPTASHYLKILLDSVFGPKNYKNDIIWKRVNTVKGNFGQGSKFFGPNVDNLLFYTKGDDHTFNPVFTEYTQDYIDIFKFQEPDGRRYRLISMIGPGGAAKGNPYYEVMGVSRYWRYSKKKMQELIDAGLVVQTSPGTVPHRKHYLDEGKGVAAQSLWEDIDAASSGERLGYPTQKPLTLLERVIGASSNPGDVVLDPFCGCGTTIHAAQKLGRKWIGIDVTHIAIFLIENRLKKAFPGISYAIHGVPQDAAGAAALANADKHEFQLWAVSRVGAQPFKGGKKGADGGIDGIVYFKPEAGKTERAIVSIKGGANVGLTMLKDLIATVDAEKAKVGVFVTLTPPTGPMTKEAVKAGFYEPPHHPKVPKIQILTVQDIFAGKLPNIPLIDTSAIKKPAKEQEAHPTLF